MPVKRNRARKTGKIKGNQKAHPAVNKGKKSVALHSLLEGGEVSTLAARFALI